ALTLDPRFPGAHLNRGLVLGEWGQAAAAASSFEQALALRPDIPFARGERLLSKLHNCDWRNYDEELTDVERRGAAGERAATPFVMLAVSGSASLQMKAASSYLQEHTHTRAPVEFPRHVTGKLKIGCFSADFR